MNKKTEEKNEKMALQGYYEKLTKKEKSDFLRYLMITFEYKYASIQSKMTGRAELNMRDLILIREVVNSESWRQ